MERRYEEMFRFLSVGDYPPGYDDSQRYYFRKSAARFTLKDGEIFVGCRRVIKSKEEARKIFKEVHSPPAGGHSGVNRTRSEISSRFYWYRMSIDVENWVKECERCKKVVKPLLVPQPLQCVKVSAVWELVGMDIVGPVPKTADGFQYILTATDYFSKWVEVYPLKTKSAAEVGRRICSMIYRHGCPKRILSDQGREFVDQLNYHMCSLLRVERSKMAAYHPQTNALDEDTNENIKRVLAELINERHNKWEVYLDAAIYPIRSKVQTASQYSPFLLMYGREAVFSDEVPVELPFVVEFLHTVPIGEVKTDAEKVTGGSSEVMKMEDGSSGSCGSTHQSTQQHGGSQGPTVGLPGGPAGSLVLKN